MKRTTPLLLVVLCFFTLFHEQAEARYYDARTGRFLTVDPRAKEFPGTSAYVYTLNNPLKYKDPDGKMPIVAPIAGVGAGVYIGGAVAIAVIGHTWSYTFNPSYRRAVDQGGTNVARVAQEALTGSVQALKESYESAKNAVLRLFSSESAPTPKESGPVAGQAPYDKPLPSDEHGNAIPTPEAEGAHTQLGQRTSKTTGQTYPQAREWDENGNKVRDIDFTDHGRAGEHPNPHKHDYDPNTAKRLGPKELGR